MNSEKKYYALQLSKRPGNDNYTYCCGPTIQQSRGAAKRYGMQQLNVRTHKAAVKLLKRRARL